jgi:indole-3-glycerol phosphate synthase
MKRRSPSKGPLCLDIDPAELARIYERSGAFAISVLTEADHFGGSTEDLALVRSAVDLPVLCKDFVSDPYQLWQARAAGADLVLLIVALLGKETSAYVRWARAAGLEPLVEVHGSDELDIAVGADARLLGINNRDLKTFTVDLGVTERLLPRVPGDVSVVSESGFKTPGEMDRLSRTGVKAFLVGEALVTAPDPGVALRQLVET